MTGDQETDTVAAENALPKPGVDGGDFERSTERHAYVQKELLEGMQQKIIQSLYFWGMRPVFDATQAEGCN
jgi:hypothetical protein